jgi:hypothetical protein
MEHPDAALKHFDGGFHASSYPVGRSSIRGFSAGCICSDWNTSRLPRGVSARRYTANPYSVGPLPKEDSGPGRDVEGPDDSTKTVKAVPCSTAAHETDGTTTCIGIPGPVGRGDSREGTGVGRSRR